MLDSTDADSPPSLAFGQGRESPSRGEVLLRVEMLGGFRVSSGDRTIRDEEWRLRKGATLIKLLALAPAYRLHREQILDILWPDLEPRAATNNLYHALHVARRTLDLPASASQYLRIRDEIVGLGPPDEIWTDVEAFESAAAAARAERSPAAYRTALDLYAGDLLPEDLYEDWAVIRREGLRSLYLALLVELASRYEERNDPGRAIDALQRVIREDPAQEDAHVALMRLYARTAQRHQALRQYELLRESLRQALDAEPEEATTRLYEEIRDGRARPEQPPETPSGAPLRPRRHNLPTALTSFVGREREVREMTRLLEEARLVTITGVGGVGKTRLALRVAGDLIGSFPDGIWLAELAPLQHPGLVPQRVADALDVPENPERPAADRLVDALSGKTLLLVLDNCEHLADACAHLVERLLGACLGLRILVTSREPLEAAGEAILTVAPLTFPEPSVSLPSDDLLEYEAVRLFVERVRHRQPAFQLTPENAHAVSRVCSQVDGIPLAIELAAARVGPLSVEQVAERLGDALALLTVGRRTSEPRQQTLRAALDWSYELLAPPERTLFLRLSVFAGGWILEDAETLAAGRTIRTDEILDLLSRLVDKSLVVAHVGAGGTIRYRMLEPVRQYAAGLLEESSEADEIRRDHAALFLSLAERAEPELTKRDQVAWYGRLETEHDNFRAALQFSLRSGDAEIGLRMAAALWRFWYVRGHLREGRRWLELLLNLPGSDKVSAYVRGRAFNGAGSLAYYQSDYESARTFYEQSLALRREIDDREGIAASSGNLGLVVKEHGDYERAEALHEESRALYESLGNKRGVANALNNLGIAAAEQGDYQRAATLHEQSLVLKRELGDKRGIATSLTNLGSLAIDQGDFARARPLQQESLVLSRELGAKRSAAISLSNLGRIERGLGNIAEALRFFKESALLLRDLGDELLIAGWLEGMVQILAMGAHREPAARLLGAAAALREARAGTAPRHDEPQQLAPIVARLRDELGTAFDEAWAAGGRMSAVEAIDDALATVEAGAPKPPDGVDPDDVSPLTRREREIAVLVAQGLTNREIARKLTISDRTVDTHVGNILGKLDLASRAQIAAWATRAALTEG